MGRLPVIILLLLGHAQAQYFTCPTSSTLFGYTGSTACSDDADPETTCMQPVDPGTICTFSYKPADGQLTSFGQLQIQANGMAADDQIVVQGIYDSVRSYPNSPTFKLRSALPFSGNQNLPFVTITITAGANSTMNFGFYLVKQIVPTIQNPTALTVGSGQLAQFLQFSKAQAAASWEIGSSGTITLTSTIASTYSDNPTDLMNIWIYQGIGQNRKLLGSAYSAQGRMLHMASNQTTVQYVLGQAVGNLQASIIANDDGNLAQCDTYSTGWATSYADEIMLTGSGGIYCFTLMNYDSVPPVYLYEVRTDTTDEVVTKLIAGAPIVDPVASQTLLATYTSTIAYPPLLSARATTFIMKSASKNVYLVFNGGIPDGFHTASPGRTGFLTTPTYPYPYSEQSVFYYMNSTTNFNITLSVQNSLTDNAVLTVYGTSTKPLFQGQVTTGWSMNFVDKMIDFDVNAFQGAPGGVLLQYSIAEPAAPPVTCPELPASLAGTIKMDPIKLPPSYECNYTFTYDSNAYADVTVSSGSWSDGEAVQVVGVYDTVMKQPSDVAFNFRAAFPANQTIIYVKTGANTTAILSFSLTRRVLPINQAAVVSLGTLEDAYYVQMVNTRSNLTCEINAKASSQVTIITALAPSTPPTDLLNFFVYEGTGPEKLLIGSLYNTNQKLWTSQGAALTVSYVPPMAPGLGTIIFNDVTNLADCPSYTVQWTGTGPTILTADGNACVTIVDDITVNSPAIFYNGTATGVALFTPEVYTGAPTLKSPFDQSSRFLGTFGVPGSPKYFDLPQQLPGFARTVYLQAGVLAFTATYDWEISRLPFAFVGRQGFIASANYPFTSSNQDLAFNLTSDPASPNPFFMVQFHVVYSDAPANTSLSVTTDAGQLSVDLTDARVIGKNYTVTGTNVSFNVVGGSNTIPNRGSYIRYQVLSYVPTTTAAPTTTAGAQTTTVGLATTTVAATPQAQTTPVAVQTTPQGTTVAATAQMGSSTGAVFTTGVQSSTTQAQTTQGQINGGLTSAPTTVAAPETTTQGVAGVSGLIAMVISFLLLQWYNIDA